MSHQQARYLEIAEYLRDLVSNAEPGDLLPSDADLCQTFNVSRMTARQAVQLLVNEQLVDRRRGKGTFVAPRRVLRLLGSPLSFTESMRQKGLVASSLPLTSQVFPASEAEADALGLPAADPVRVIERVRLADEVPMAIERVVIPTAVASKVELQESGSLHSVFQEAGFIPSKALSNITARLSTDWEQDQLEIGPSSVILAEERTIFDQHDVPIEHTLTVYVADRYTFSVAFAPDTENTLG